MKLRSQTGPGILPTIQKTLALPGPLLSKWLPPQLEDTFQRILRHLFQETSTLLAVYSTNIYGAFAR